MTGEAFGILCMVVLVLIFILVKVAEGNGYQRAMIERVTQIKQVTSAIQKTTEKELPRITAPAPPIPSPTPFLTEVERKTLKDEIDAKELEIARLHRVISSIGKSVADARAEATPT